MWSSVVLLKCDVVGLSLDEQNDIRLNNFIPIAHTGQISDEMERQLRHLPYQPVTLTEMGPALIRIWNNIPLAFFNNLVRIMRRRCQACINGVKDRVKLLAMVTNQHFAVSDSHALLAQHVVARCLAEM
jgi:hypothetical protein